MDSPLSYRKYSFILLLLCNTASAGNLLHFDYRGNFSRNEFITNVDGVRGVLHSADGMIHFVFNDPDAITTVIEKGLNPITVTPLKFGDVESCVQDRIRTIWEKDSSSYKILMRIKKESFPEGKMDFGGKCGLIKTRDTRMNDEGYNNIEFSIINGIAYAPWDGGNFLWGMALSMLHVSYRMAKIGSEVNAWLWSKDQNGINHKSWFDSFEWSGDALRDQRAIKRGFYGAHFKF